MSREPEGPLIAIAGGGISGLATALAIRDRSTPPPRLVVLEPERQVGGKIRTLEDDGFTCEWGVNGFLNKEPRTLELCRRLDLEEKLLPASGAFNNRYIYTRNRLRAVKMHPLKFMFSGILPFGAKLRLIRELWVKSRIPEGQDESVADFARRRVGPGAFRVLVDPMQTGIFAGDPEQMSVVSCFPRVVEVEREYGSLIRGMVRLAKERRRAGGNNQDRNSPPGAGPAGHLTSFRGGMRTLVERLAHELGDSVRLGSRVTAVRRDAEGRLEVTVDREGETELLRADAVVLACPAHESAKITADLDHRLSEPLSQIPYSPLVVVCLGLPRDQVDHPMDGFGFLVPRSEGLRLLGGLWTSTLFPERAPEGHVLMRIMIGGSRDPDVLDLDDEQLTRAVLEEVRQVHGRVGDPAFIRIFRHRRGIPQYVMGHQDRLTTLENRQTDLPGLFLTGNAYRGIGVNDCARNAHDTADRVVGWLAERRTAVTGPS